MIRWQSKDKKIILNFEKRYENKKDETNKKIKETKNEK
jgi:hypothetical protein